MLPSPEQPPLHFFFQVRRKCAPQVVCSLCGKKLQDFDLVTLKYGCVPYHAFPSDCHSSAADLLDQGFLCIRCNYWNPPVNGVNPRCRICGRDDNGRW